MQIRSHGRRCSYSCAARSLSPRNPHTSDSSATAIGHWVSRGNTEKSSAARISNSSRASSSRPTSASRRASAVRHAGIPGNCCIRPLTSGSISASLACSRRMANIWAPKNPLALVCSVRWPAARAARASRSASSMRPSNSARPAGRVAAAQSQLGSRSSSASRAKVSISRSIAEMSPRAMRATIRSIREVIANFRSPACSASSTASLASASLPSISSRPSLSDSALMPIEWDIACDSVPGSPNRRATATASSARAPDRGLAVENCSSRWRHIRSFTRKGLSSSPIRFNASSTRAATCS